MVTVLPGALHLGVVAGGVAPYSVRTR
jgi:hypothetical protein